MAQIAKETIIKALSLLDNYDQNVASEVKVNEDKLDLYEDKLYYPGAAEQQGPL